MNKDTRESRRALQDSGGPGQLLQIDCIAYTD